MGTPKQELWVQEHCRPLDVDVFWTVGALFDYVSGRVPRAPGWLADNGLEWIFRLGIEPQRMWRRYLLGNPVFLSPGDGAGARAQRGSTHAPPAPSSRRPSRRAPLRRGRAPASACAALRRGAAV